MQPDEFADLFNVPRGTIEKLEAYAALLGEWQQKMNLVGPSTLEDVWARHFADSAQLMRYVSAGRSWVDVGAGAGFPGMVLALMGWGQVTLVESIAKKCHFLEAVKSTLLVENVAIRHGRAEDLEPIRAEVGTARATAPLARLLEIVPRHIGKGGVLIFPKGRNWRAEVVEARRKFCFHLESHDSLTDSEARILVLHDVRRRSFKRRG